MSQDLTLLEVARRLERLGKNRKGKFNGESLLTILILGELAATVRFSDSISVTVPTEYWQSISRTSFLRLVKRRKQVKFAVIAANYAAEKASQIKSDLSANETEKLYSAALIDFAKAATVKYTPFVLAQNWQQYLAKKQLPDPVEPIKKGANQKVGWKELVQIIGTEMLKEDITSLRVKPMTRKVLELAKNHVPKISSLPGERSIEDLLAAIKAQAKRSAD